MKKLGHIAVWGCFLISAFWAFYGSSKYFSQDPSDLIYIFAIAIVGGLLFWLYSKCSPNLKRKIRLVVWGLLAIGITYVTTELIIVVMRLPREFLQGKLLIYFEAYGVLMIVLTCYCWWQFYQFYKKDNK